MSEFIDVGGSEIEAIDDQEELQAQVGAELEAADDVEVEDTGGDLPEALLSDEQREAREAAAERRREASSARETEERNATLDGMREFFAQIKKPAVVEEAPVQQPRQRFKMTDEQAEELSNKILAGKGGLARAFEAMAESVRQQTIEEVRNDPTTGTLLSTTAAVLSQDFIESKLDDPREKFATQVRPFFKEALAEWNTADLARMSAAERQRTLQNVWDIAGGRFLRKGGEPKRAPAAGTGRGGPNIGGAPGKKLHFKMTEQAKKDLRASAPNYFKGPEGEKRFQRQVAEIEHGVTSDSKIAAQVKDSQRFSEAVSFGG